jgi:hypothetical protein
VKGKLVEIFILKGNNSDENEKIPETPETNVECSSLGKKFFYYEGTKQEERTGPSVAGMAVDHKKSFFGKIAESEKIDRSGAPMLKNLKKLSFELNITGEEGGEENQEGSLLRGGSIIFYFLPGNFTKFKIKKRC